MKLLYLDFDLDSKIEKVLNFQFGDLELMKIPLFQLLLDIFVYGFLLLNFDRGLLRSLYCWLSKFLEFVCKFGIWDLRWFDLLN